MPRGSSSSDDRPTTGPGEPARAPGPAAGAGRAHGAKTALRRHLGGVAFCLLLAAAAGLAVTALVLTLRHSLAYGGTWSSVKTEMELELLGSRSFHQGRQALAGGDLDLAAWHGYHEVRSIRTLDWEALELDVRLDDGAWLAVLFELGPGRPTGGVRLSRSRHFPPIAFEVDVEGAFVERAGAPWSQLADGEWHRLRLERTGAAGTRLLLDGVEAGVVPLQVSGPGRVGFRGGYRGAWVDDVRVLGRGGGGDRVLLRDDFDWPRGAGWRFAAGAAAAAALTLALLALALPRAGRRQLPLLFSIALAWIVILVCAALLVPWANRSAGAYPEADRELRAQEEVWRREEVDRIRRRVTELYAPRPPAGTLRILAVGTSQTWGAGARREPDVWVARLERLLADALPAGTRIEAINAGVSSARSNHLAPLVEGEWLALEPDLVLIDLGNNDRQAVPFERNVRRMATASLAAGARVALILEPNSIERWGPHLAQRHELLRQLGRELGVPVIEMQHHLRGLHDTGFLWWDKVHLTSYGHRLFAEKVAAELAASGLLAEAGGTAPEADE